MKRVFSGILTLVILLGMMSMAALAENYDFNDQQQKLEPIFDGSTDAGQGAYNRHRGNGYYTYEEALAGKGARDFSQGIYLDNIPKDDQANDGFFLGTEFSVGESGKTIEFSFLAEGDYDCVRMIHRPKLTGGSLGFNDSFLQFQQGGRVTTSAGRAVSTYQKGHWQRVAFTVYSSGEAEVFLNGEKIIERTMLFSGGITGYNWLQFTFGIPKNSTVVTAEQRNAHLAMDDFKAYDGAYVTEGNEAELELDPDSGFTVIHAKKGISLPQGATVEQLQSAMGVQETPALYQDATLQTKITEGEIPMGAVLIIPSVNRLIWRYYTFSDLETLSGIRAVDFESGQTLNTADTNYGVAAHEEGLFGKSSTAYVINASGVPGNVKENGGRFAFQDGISQINEPSWDNLNVEKPSVTIEFSAACSGDSGFQLVGRPRFYDTQNPEDESLKGYMEYLTVDPRGMVTIVNQPVDLTVRQNEWIRVAMAIDAQALTYDLYLNGEKVVSDGEVYAGITDAQRYLYRGFNWISLMGHYPMLSESDSSLRSGKVAIDDFEVYYGDYQTRAESTVELETSYPMDGDILYVEEGTDLLDFVGNLNYGDARAMLYTDNSYSETPSATAEGNVLVLTSPDGKVMRYYHLQAPSVQVEDTIELYVNDEMSNILSAGTLKAKIIAAAAALTEQKGCLALAVYRDGVLETIVTDEKALSGTTEFETEYQLENTDGIQVKAFFWNGIGGLKPLADSREYISLP